MLPHSAEAFEVDVFTAEHFTLGLASVRPASADSFTLILAEGKPVLLDYNYLRVGR